MVRTPRAGRHLPRGAGALRSSAKRPELHGAPLAPDPRNAARDQQRDQSLDPHESGEYLGADLFLSIHTNASLDTSANGSESLVYRIPSTAADIAGAIQTQLTALTGFRNRGVIARPGLWVLRKTRMPAVLSEIGFLSNPSEAAQMNENPGLFAEGIYRGLVAYYGV